MGWSEKLGSIRVLVWLEPQEEMTLTRESHKRGTRTKCTPAATYIQRAGRVGNWPQKDKENQGVKSERTGFPEGKRSVVDAIQPRERSEWRRVLDLPKSWSSISIPATAIKTNPPKPFSSPTTVLVLVNGSIIHAVFSL